MKRLRIPWIVQLLSIPIVCTVTSSHATDITVRSDTELEQAVLDANDGTYNNIVIDARSSGNTFEISNVYLEVLSGNGGANSGYRIGTFQDAAVTLKAADGSQSGFNIAGDMDTTTRVLTTIDNISFDGFGTAIQISNSELDITGRGDIRFSNNDIAVDFTNENYDFPPSTLRFKNLGSVVFENGTSGIQNRGYPVPIQTEVSFDNEGDVVFRNLSDSGIYTSLHGAEFIFRNKGNVIFDSITNRAFYSWGSHLVDFDNDGDVTFSDIGSSGSGLIGGAFSVQFDDNNSGPRADRFNNRGDVVVRRSRAMDGGGMSFELSSSEDYSLTLTNTGDTVFEGNIAYGNEYDPDSGRGGAVFLSNSGDGRGDLTFAGQGNTYFHNNTAVSLGGAIYFNGGQTAGQGRLTFAPSGDSVVEFKNNWQGALIDTEGNIDLSAARSNSIYIKEYGDIYLSPSEKASILFRDPIVAAATNRGAINIIQNGSGTTRLWNGWDYANDDIAPALLGGTVTLESGRFLAMNNAVYTSGQSPDGVDSLLYMTTNAGATLGFSVDRSGGHSLINAQSFAVEDGAHLYVSGISTLDAGEQYRDYQDVVISNSAIVGSLSTMEINNDYMHAELVKNGANRADLIIHRVNSVESQLGSVGVFLDIMRLNPILPAELSWELDDLYHYGVLTPEMEELLQVVSGTDVLNAMNAMRTNGRLFHQAMVARMDEVNERAGSYCRLPPGHLLRLCSRNLKAEQLWGTFTQDWTKQEGGFLRSSYSYRPSMFAVGRDHHYGPWTAGIAFQYGHGTTYSGTRSYSNTKTDSATLGLYAGRNYGKNYLKVTAQAGLGYNETRTHYRTLGLDADADFLSGTLGAGLEFGRVIRFGCATHPWDITPHVGAEYLFIGSESFMESGAKGQVSPFGLSFGQDLARRFQGARYNVVEVPLGFRVAKTFQFAEAPIERLRPSADLMYVRSAGDNVASTQVRFLNSPNYPWTIDGSSMGRDAFRMNVGLAMRFAGDWDLDVSYGLETRRNHNSQQLNASLSRRW